MRIFQAIQEDFYLIFCSQHDKHFSTVSSRKNRQTKSHRRSQNPCQAACRKFEKPTGGRP